MMTLYELSGLIEDFADANDEFKQLHSENYRSESCRYAYERKEAIFETLEDALKKTLELFPRELAAALRQAIPPLTEEQPS